MRTFLEEVLLPSFMRGAFFSQNKDEILGHPDADLFSTAVSLKLPQMSLGSNMSSGIFHQTVAGLSPMSSNKGRTHEFH